MKDTTPRPVYFNSPGGEMRQAFAIGRLLRSRRVVGRIGRTVVTACPGSQTDDACGLIKTARDDVVARITTFDAACSSSCSYLLFCTLMREVAPDAVMAVHSPKVVMEFQLNAAGMVDKAYGLADRLASSYIDEMGIRRELLALVNTLSYENAHALTRQELFRFRIDTRDFVETEWTLVKATPPFIRKLAEVKKGEGFRRFEWRLICASETSARLMFFDEPDKDVPGTAGVAMVVGSEKPAQFARLPVRLGAYEIWTAAIGPEAMKNLLVVPRLGMGQGDLPPDVKATSTFLEIETRGLEPAWKRLSATCRAPVSAAVTKWPSPQLPKWPAPPPWPTPSSPSPR